MWEKVIKLRLHEASHHRFSDHLSSDFHEECCRLGAKLALAVAADPEKFEKYR